MAMRSPSSTSNESAYSMYFGDRDDVDVDAVSLVEWAGSAGQLRERDQIRALALQNVDVCRWPQQTVALRDDESAEAI